MTPILKGVTVSLTNLGEKTRISSMNNELARTDEAGWADRELVVEQVFERIPDRYAYLKFIEGIAEGQKTKVLLAELKLEWSEFVEMYGHDKRLYDLYCQAKERGEAFRQAVREDEADRRAVEGTLEPQFHKGEICGYVRKYSDQLLALQLKAGNPDKYADRQKHQHEGVMLNLNVQGVEREQKE
jgi:hypothetical protein